MTEAVISILHILTHLIQQLGWHYYYYHYYYYYYFTGEVRHRVEVICPRSNSKLVAELRNLGSKLHALKHFTYSSQTF